MLTVVVIICPWKLMLGTGVQMQQALPLSNASIHKANVLEGSIVKMATLVCFVKSANMIRGTHVISHSHATAAISLGKFGY
jgi:hypothetical protein